MDFTRQNILVLLEQGYELWLRELGAALPERFRIYIGDSRWLRVGEDDARAPGAELRPWAVLIEADKILLRQIELPLVSRWQLTKLMQYEKLQHVPLPLDQVITDFRIVERHNKTGRMRIELAIMRREMVKAALDSARAKGIEPDALAIPSDSGIWFARRPLQVRWQDILRRPHIQRVAIKLVVPTGLALLCIVVAQGWAGRFAASREAEALTMRQQAAPIAPLRQQLTTLDTKLSVLVQAYAQPSAAAAIEEVARLLPDDAWLQELDIEDKTVTLRGTAQHATALLKIFSGSPLFSNVQFDAPLTQAFTGGGQQFDITMTRN